MFKYKYHSVYSIITQHMSSSKVKSQIEQLAIYVSIALEKCFLVPKVNNIEHIFICCLRARK